MKTLLCLPILSFPRLANLESSTEGGMAWNSRGQT